MIRAPVLGYVHYTARHHITHSHYNTELTTITATSHHHYSRSGVRDTVHLRLHQPTGHFGDESFQSTTCTGTDNQSRTSKRWNTGRIKANTAKLDSVKNTQKNLVKTKDRQNLVQFLFTTSGHTKVRNEEDSRPSLVTFLTSSQ